MRLVRAIVPDTGNPFRLIFAVQEYPVPANRSDRGLFGNSGPATGRTEGNMPI